MTAPLPVDVSGISTPLPDAGHESIRLAVLNAITQVWAEHQSLVDQLATTNAAVATTQTDIAALQAQVAALLPPVT